MSLFEGVIEKFSELSGSNPVSTTYNLEGANFIASFRDIIYNHSRDYSHEDVADELADLDVLIDALREEHPDEDSLKVIEGGAKLLSRSPRKGIMILKDVQDLTCAMTELARGELEKLNQRLDPHSIPQHG